MVDRPNGSSRSDLRVVAATVVPARRRQAPARAASRSKADCSASPALRQLHRQDRRRIRLRELARRVSNRALRPQPLARRARPPRPRPGQCPSVERLPRVALPQTVPHCSVVCSQLPVAASRRSKLVPARAQAAPRPRAPVSFSHHREPDPARQRLVPRHVRPCRLLSGRQRRRPIGRQRARRARALRARYSVRRLHLDPQRHRARAARAALRHGLPSLRGRRLAARARPGLQPRSVRRPEARPRPARHRNHGRAALVRHLRAPPLRLAAPARRARLSAPRRAARKAGSAAAASRPGYAIADCANRSCEPIVRNDRAKCSFELMIRGSDFLKPAVPRQIQRGPDGGLAHQLKQPAVGLQLDAVTGGFLGQEAVQVGALVIA